MTTTLGSRLAAVLVPAAVALATAGPAPAQQNPVCARLEGQLAAFDRGPTDPARIEQVKHFEAAASKQQFELDRHLATSKRTGCEGTGFFLFGGQPAQCGPLNKQIQQMRANLERIEADLAQLQGGAAPEREAQRRTILTALSQNDCGPQYRQAAAPQRGGLFETLFGGPGSSIINGITNPGGDAPQGSGYRTVCVRMCDGYFYPISYSTSPGKFSDDERTCQRSCPAAEVMLFAHRNPGEDINQAVSTGGQLYSSLPNAFRYRQAFDQSCSCKRSGESWSHALRDIEDSTVERGDIVVNEERAKQLSQPRVDAQGKPIKQELPPRPAKPDPRTAKPAAGGDSPEEAGPAPVPRDPNRPVRAVGPTFIPR